MLKKTITIQLKPSKTSRHLVFEIRLETQQHKAKRWDTLEEVEGLPVLSVCGSYRLGSCVCQQQDTIRTYRERVRAEDLETFDFILYIWDKYHLNDTKAGTAEQEKALEEARARGFFESLKARGLYSWYDSECDYLEGLGLLTDRGYKFGTSWLYQTIEAEDLAKIEKLLRA